jgi:TrmH family RNA methyltransferase
VDVVLVRPARPANVAAAARALKNMGVSRLTLVDAPSGMDAEARALAYGAWDVLDGARAVPRLEQALAGCAFVVGASARGGVDAWTPRQLAERAAERAGTARMAVVFGPEASGLSNAELLLCHETVTIPTRVRQPSLNLAQAVLLIAYELQLAAAPVPALVATPAPASALEAALEELRAALLAIGYLNPANPDAILAELRRLLGRGAPSEREASLLRGMARQIAWAGAELARLRAPKANA